eukprot:TRINITY_DN8368_c0_g1_i2.p1 TRINITY_DN8368_c0_g1~~TRINITY_DN8368_c0_g1_i2.p1  ORF type:complete len:227 (+),score=13.25 TRINITY_DN8368_c0_g1_i2:51-731(+)
MEKNNRIKGVVAACFYVLVSTIMTFCNKHLLSVYKYSHVITLVAMQSVIILVIIQVLNHLKITKIKWDWALQRELFYPSLSQALNTIVALTALAHLNIAMYGTLKRLTVMFILIGEMVFLRKFPSTNIVLSVTIIVSGTLIAGYNDLEFHLPSYVFALASCVFQSSYLVLIKQSKTRPLDLLLYNSVTSAFLIGFASIVTGDVFSFIDSYNWTDINFVVCILQVLL